jgi:hypothetical protein
MCWMGNNRLVVSSKLQLTTFIVTNDGGHHDQDTIDDISLSHHNHHVDANTSSRSRSNVEKEEKGRNDHDDEMLSVMRMKSSSMIRTESYRMLTRLPNVISPLLIPSSFSSFMADDQKQSSLDHHHQNHQNEKKRNEEVDEDDRSCVLIGDQGVRIFARTSSISLLL